MQRVTSFFATMALLGLLSGPAAAVTLIKDEEARLPAAAGGLVTRGITRGSRSTGVAFR